MATVILNTGANATSGSGTANPTGALNATQYTGLSGAYGVTPANGVLKQGGSISFVVDFANAFKVKGSALAAGDILQTLLIPVGWMVTNVAVTPTVLPLNKLGAATTKLTFNVGYTAQATAYGNKVGIASGTINVPANITGLQSAKTVKTYVPTVTGTNTNINCTINTLTGSVYSGTVRLDVIIQPINTTNQG